MYPAWKKYSNYSTERRELEQKYNRLYRARKDLLSHFDWANARGDSIEQTESMGREIERMDMEMAEIAEEIEQLDRNKFNLVGVPLQTIKSHKM